MDGREKLHAAVDSGDDKFRVAELGDEDTALAQVAGVGCGGDGRGGWIVGGRVGDEDAGSVVVDLALGDAVVFDRGLYLAVEGKRGECPVERSEQAEALDFGEGFTVGSGIKS